MKKSPRVCTAPDAVDRYADATGRLVSMLPPGPERDELLGLVRVGAKFKAQQRAGKRRGALANLVLDCVRLAGLPYSFEHLLTDLSYAAQTRKLLDVPSIVLDVDRVDELVVIHLPRHGPKEIPFGTLRNALTRAIKRLAAEIHASP